MSNDKATLVNSVAILLSCTNHIAGISKLSVPTLEAVYRGQLKNANAWSGVKDEALEAKRKNFILEKQVIALEAELKRLKAKTRKG